jgi:hypothetical protein
MRKLSAVDVIAIMVAGAFVAWYTAYLFGVVD